MGLQSFPSSECPAARIVFASQRAVLVCAVMLGQFSVTMESLAARVVLAGERLLVYMGALMPIQRPMVMKSLAARLVVASTRTLIRMLAVVGREG